MKTFLKKVIPKKIIIFIKLALRYKYDFQLFFQNSNVLQNFDNQEKLAGKLTIYYHVIEKGLTMPNSKLGFGQPVAGELLELVALYSKLGYPEELIEYQHSVKVLNEYFKLHSEHGFKLKDSLIQSYELLKNKLNFSDEKSEQLSFSSEEYFSKKNERFDRFAESRFSCRNYSNKKVPEQLLEKCISIAQKTPTSCNRQLNRVHLVRSTEKKKEVLKLQYGNRGFGFLADTIVVLTADISYFQGPNDRNESYINTGMFAMSLLYAFHQNEIAACPLNWSVEPERDIAIRKLLKIPNTERIGILISCGFPPDRFKIAISPRKNVNQLFKTY